MIAKMNAAASKGSDKRNKSTGAANGANAAISAHTPPIAAGEFFRQDAALKRVELGLQLPVVVFPFGEWLPFVGTLELEICTVDFSASDSFCDGRSCIRAHLHAVDPEPDVFELVHYFIAKLSAWKCYAHKSDALSVSALPDLPPELYSPRSSPGL